MKACLTIPSMAKANGGPVAVVRDLADHLSKIGCDVVIGTQSLNFDEEEWLPRSTSVEIARVDSVSQGVDIFCDDRPDIIHDFGLWLPANHQMVQVGLQLRIPIVISPCGMLNPWALSHKKWKKKVAWHLYQKRDLQKAALIMATASEEAEHIANQDLGRPVAIVPNGVDFSELEVEVLPVSKKKDRIVLFLGRVHKVKGLINLVEAWARVLPSGWRCVIAGPDEDGHQAEVETCIKNNNLENSFDFIGSVDGTQKLKVLREADLFVLPSFTENFGIAAAEAMAVGVPVITTKGTPWKELATRSCGWWVDIGVSPLSAALKEATLMIPQDLEEKGRLSQDYIQNHFAWPQVASQMKEVYEWVLGGGDKPECVQL